MATGKTHYSRMAKGNRGNFHREARFDLTDGFLGITAGQPRLRPPLERVLLSPAQVKALLAFLKEKP